ncbi:integrin beta-2-like [Amia ocellicauda]|uniref:integrin beta-2-like n=1 Tax=Amia ocellicauda TaxID=2972642 RepID=UPI0034645A96
MRLCIATQSRGFWVSAARRGPQTRRRYSSEINSADWLSRIFAEPRPIAECWGLVCNNFLNPGEPGSARCDTKAKLEERGCKTSDIINPQGFDAAENNVPLQGGSSPIQLKPQTVQLELRPNQPHIFPVTFKRAEGYPVDLYSLMDLSYSMKDDLNNVKTLGKQILLALKKITPNAAIGFGSFVDKTVLPYTNTNPEKLQKPCPVEETQCQAAFGFKHVLSLTNNENMFNTEVSKQYISGNLDPPEGGLDAIMQAAVCEREIGWGNNTRLLVYTTDDGFHMAGDGKLGAILKPNDGECHLIGNQYSKSNELDYPSVGQLAKKSSENNIQPIFAITFNVTVTAGNCMGEQSFEIRPLGFTETMVVKISTRCQCECDENPDSHKDYCTDAGNVMCGICSCNAGYVGQKCECKVGQKTERDLTLACRKDNGTICSGLGDCVCGVCSCHASEDGRKIYGKYCECDDMNCELNRGKVCGGNGKCDCGKCICNEGFQGSACQCSVSTEGCRNSRGAVCSGRGNCECNVCQCQSGYQLPFCEECPACLSPCPTYAHCIECLGFGTGPFDNNCSETCQKISYTIKDDLGSVKVCKEKDKDNCWMIFRMTELDGQQQYAAEIRKERECYEAPSSAVIAGATSGVLLLTGLLALLL